ncbi:MAG: efflux RND transporter permease subunit [Sulfurifustis sp.]
MTAKRLTTLAARLAGWPVRHPGLAFLAAVLLALGGMVFAGRLPLARTSPMPAPEVRVQARFPGVDPATVEAEVTVPIEIGLATLPGLQSVESRTGDGVAEIALRWVSAAARDQYLEEVREHLRSVSQLPPAIDAPVVEAHESRVPAVVYAVTSTVPQASAAQWIEHMLARPLRELPEVAAVAVEGMPEQEISIQPDVKRLAALGLTFDDLVHALREPNAVARRSARRRPVMVGSAEGIAARAVRLPSGEPIALAEVARIAVVERPRPAPRYQNEPALRLVVYPRLPADAARVAERAHAHVAWLRANDLIPPEVAVHVVRDESRLEKQALKRYARRAAVFIAATLLATALLFGLYAGGLLLAAYLVWLPASAALLWAAGLTLDAAVLAGVMLACVPLVVLVASPRFVAAASLFTGAAVLAGISAPWLSDYVASGPALALTLLLGIFVAWLLTPWMRAKDTVSVFPAWLELRQPERVAAILLGVAILSAAVVSANALNVGDAAAEEGAFQLRLRGDDADKVAAAGAEAQLALQKLAGTERLWSSGTVAATVRLALDHERLDALGIPLAQIGRALAIARDGLVVGEIVHGETLYRLRLQLPSGAAGETFERLLLRGEQDGQPTVYLRDVGVAVREWQPLERLRVDGKPAVEIRLHWKGGQALQALKRFCREMSSTEDYERECRFDEGMS